MATNIVVNNILSFVQCSRDSETNTEILRTVECFYKYEEVVTAKDLIMKEIDENSIRRKGVKKLSSEIEDIVSAFDTAEQKNIELPTFAAVGKHSVPPTNGFEFVKETLDFLMNEIKSLRSEVAALRDQKAKENTNLILASIQGLKSEVTGRSENNPSTSSDKKTFATALQTAIPSQPNDVISKASGKGGHDIKNKRKETQNTQTMSDSSTGNPKRTQTKKGANGNGPNDRGGKPRYKHEVIRGTKSPGNLSKGGLVGAERRADLYIGGCGKSVTPEDIEEYFKNTLKIQFREVEPLKTKSTRFNAFRVNLKQKDREALLDANLWPEEIVVRKFITPRGASKESFNSKSDVGNVSQTVRQE